MKIICQRCASIFLLMTGSDRLVRNWYPACQQPLRAHVWTLCVFACAPVSMAVQFSWNFSVEIRWHQLYLPKLMHCQLATLCSKRRTKKKASLSLLFPGSVWPAVSPVLRRSLVDFASCEGGESQPEGGWLAAIRTKKVQIMLKS